jgi:hypothetical protein
VAAALVLLMALAGSAAPAAAQAGPAEVILLRGQFDVFSNGVNAIGQALRRAGVPARSRGHAEWGGLLARHRGTPPGRGRSAARGSHRPLAGRQ